MPSAALADPADLDEAVLAYLVTRGFTRSSKAFEKEAEVKAGTEGQLVQFWTSYMASVSR